MKKVRYFIGFISILTGFSGCSMTAADWQAVNNALAETNRELAYSNAQMANSYGYGTTPSYTGFSGSDGSYHSWQGSGYHKNSRGNVFDNDGNRMPQYDSGPETEYHSWQGGGYHRNGWGEVYDNDGNRMPQYD